MMGGGIYSDDQGSTRKHYFGSENFQFDRSLSENEEGGSSELFEIELGIEVRSNRKQEDDCECEFEGSWFSFDFRKSNHCVYVGIGDNIDSSMDALKWTLNFAVLPSTVVYLLHIFPEIRFVPSPLGMLPKSQVSPRLVERHMAEERAKRTEFLRKFVDTCSAAEFEQVKVEAVMIESDMVAKAILDLISIFQIRKLILGSTKTRKWRSKRGALARQVLQNAGEFCDVKIICEGKEATYQMIESSSSSSSNILSPNISDNENFDIKRMQKKYRHNSFFWCRCFGY
ncbi:uncharacterized protein LOC111012574 isoform X2 [Momordica charantia]|uniref:Uncharacterized protein LOC111012574 isoform X2 n=1 Tax=Momordica charantia TaxID=3673 RepID=A0A6J1CKY9_MOMCH|nr:uncharacterized protein LOC111012574 isoform X2 [Momordica charantia]